MNLADPDIRGVALRVCTEKEYEALDLQHRGLSMWNIGLALGLSKSAVRDRINNGWRKIELELRRQKENAA